MKALQAANVETVIVFRACLPIAVGVVESLFMGRDWPNTRSLISLVALAAEAVAYCLSVAEFHLNGLEAYYWSIVYFFCIVAEMTYGKTITSSVKMNSVWGPVLYCNALAALQDYI